MSQSDDTPTRTASVDDTTPSDDTMSNDEATNERATIEFSNLEKSFANGDETFTVFENLDF